MSKLRKDIVNAIEEAIIMETCKDCMEMLGEKRPACVYDTELCALHIEREWSEEIIKALDLLKKNKITTEQYDQVRISCKVENKGV